MAIKNGSLSADRRTRQTRQDDTIFSFRGSCFAINIMKKREMQISAFFVFTVKTRKKIQKQTININYKLPLQHLMPFKTSFEDIKGNTYSNIRFNKKKLPYTSCISMCTVFSSFITRKPL